MVETCTGCSYELGSGGEVPNCFPVPGLPGIHVHADRRPSPESMGEIRRIIGLTKTKFAEEDARKLLSDVLREDGFLYCADKALTCDDHNIRIGHAIKAIVRALKTTIPA